MSSTPSFKPPTPSPGEPVEPFEVAQRSLRDAAALIETFGLFGLLWLDADLIVRRCYGRIVAFVALNKPVTDSLAPLIGLEGEIQSLRCGPQRSLELPAVSIASADGVADKLNLSFFWSSRQSEIIALAHRTHAQTELELQLSRQIRARLMAEADSAAKSRELARANADLESFAAIVSHDLNAPLRHMRNLANSARENLTSSAADTAIALERIAVQAQRMSHMLQRLFDYSSLGRKYEALELVDTGALVAAIVDSLPSSEFEIAIDGVWPRLMTLRAPLDLVLRNLICNTIQHHDRETGLIRVACADSQDALVITVADDGPGVAFEHQRAIFRPFRTLADSEQSQTTGMGLAMVHRTMESVGGAITISSTPTAQRGAVFAVQWPKLIDHG